MPAHGIKTHVERSTTLMNITVQRRRPAMASWFEAVLVGDDEEHLSAVADAALDEIVRIEGLLSRFDPASEIARINREGNERPVTVDFEVLSVLLDCRSRWQQTGGYFDVAATRVTSGVARPESAKGVIDVDEQSTPFANSGRATLAPTGFAAVDIDEQRRMVRLLNADVQLDLGGYGKGYALDAAGKLLRDYGVSSAMLHGGTSSILLLGNGPDRRVWRVGVRNPLSEQDDEEICQLQLTDCGFSSSALLGPNTTESDIVNPRSLMPRTEQAACCVVARNALDAEVLSTALLAMGRPKAENYIQTCQHCQRGDVHVAWIEPHEDSARLRWLTDPALIPWSS
jgi:thiamine biosynthesis lipoprotein